MPHSPRRHGFTLIEMSVVLVIISLILGGVLATRSYLKGAELTTEINQSKYYINAFNQFVDRYQTPPGDLSTASTTWTGAGNGDGNGVIRTNTACSAGTAASCNTVEVFQAFQHLSKAGFIDGSYTGATTGGGGTFYATAGTNVPRMAVPNTSIILDHPDTLDGNISSNSYYFDGLYNHVLRVAGLNAGTNGLPSVAFMSPGTALRVDAKFDDGVPNAGWIVTPNQTALSTCTAGSGPYTYNATGTEADACYFILRIQ